MNHSVAGKFFLLKRTDNRKETPAPKTSPGRPREREFTIYGWNACLAAFENRPDDIRRVFFSKERSPRLAAVKRWCQQHKLPYRELDTESLNKVAASTHHEGAVMVVRPKTMQPVHGLIRNSLPPNSVIVALDRVGDTHNLGAILRSCAFFGVAGMIIGSHEDQALVTSYAARMAEGALETVPVHQSSDLASALRDFKKNDVCVLGADMDAEHSIYDAKITFPCVVVVGSEKDGLSEKVKKRCDLLVKIPGQGAMQSLNVSVATGVILAELNRRKSKLRK